MLPYWALMSPGPRPRTDVSIGIMSLKISHCYERQLLPLQRTHSVTHALLLDLVCNQSRLQTTATPPRCSQPSHDIKQGQQTPLSFYTIFLHHAGGHGYGSVCKPIRQGLKATTRSVIKVPSHCVNSQNYMRGITASLPPLF